MSAPPRTGSKMIEAEGVKLSVFVVELSNAVIALFHDSPDVKLGTLAFATPQTQAGPAPSTVFLGDRNAHVARVLAEFFAQRFNKLCLTGVHLQAIAHPETARRLMKLAQAFGFEDR